MLNQNRSQVADLTEDQDMFEKNSNKKINAVTASSGWSTFFWKFLRIRMDDEHRTNIKLVLRHFNKFDQFKLMQTQCDRK